MTDSSTATFCLSGSGLIYSSVPKPKRLAKDVFDRESLISTRLSGPFRNLRSAFLHLFHPTSSLVHSPRHSVCAQSLLSSIHAQRLHPPCCLPLPFSSPVCFPLNKGGSTARLLRLRIVASLHHASCHHQFPLSPLLVCLHVAVGSQRSLSPKS